MKWIRRFLFVLACLFGPLWIYEQISRQFDRWDMPSAPGSFVDIGGYRLHTQMYGSGDLTVVFDSGMGFPSLDWALIQPEVAKFARTFSYDRAGIGWSDKSPLPRTAEHIVTELHKLLIAAQVPKPYLLVGHSMGGIHMRLFANRYPDEVAGLVLVDSSHEQMLERLPSDPLQSGSHRLLGAFLLNSGLQRLLMKLPAAKEFVSSLYKGYPDPLGELYMKIQNLAHHQKITLEEDAASSESLNQLKKYPSSLGSKPLAVVTAGSLTFLGEEVGYTKEWLDESYREWAALQKELLGLSSRSRQFIADRSDHLIPRRQPEIIVEAIHSILMEIMHPNPE